MQPAKKNRGARTGTRWERADTQPPLGQPALEQDRAAQQLAYRHIAPLLEEGQALQQVPLRLQFRRHFDGASPGLQPCQQAQLWSLRERLTSHVEGTQPALASRQEGKRGECCNHELRNEQESGWS
jgi:hypothetical protein